MHILCISLTGKNSQGARAIQMAKVLKALQMQGVYVTFITGRNERLQDFDTDAGNIISLEALYPKRTGFLHRITDSARKLVGGLVPKHEKYTQLAIREALNVVNKEKVDCLFTCSNPVSSQVAGLAVARETGLPWMASFSDPKPSTMLPPPYGGGIKKYMPKVYTRYIREVLKSCDEIHMPTRICLELMEDYYNVPVTDKSIVIPPIGETTYEPETNTYKKHIVHLGSTSRRLSKAFLQGVRTFYATHPTTGYQLLFVGKHFRRTATAIKKYRLHKLVRSAPHVTHKEALTMVNSAIGTLILEADMPYSHALPSKFAEAAFSGTPILAVCPARSAVKEYLDTFGGGIAVTHRPEEIAGGLEKIFNNTPEEISRMAEEQKALAAKFSYQETGNRYQTVFARLTG